MSKFLSYMGKLSKWRRDEAGATAVEFVIVMPILLVTFAVIVEGARIYWNYQAAVSGVRDAARYVARTTNNDVCTSGGLPAGVTTTATGIVRASIDGALDTTRRATSLTGNRTVTLFDFPSGVALAANNPVTTSLSCVGIVVSGTTVATAPVVRVNANIVINLPLAPLWDFFLPGAQNGILISTITDQSRVYGI